MLSCSLPVTCNPLNPNRKQLTESLDMVAEAQDAKDHAERVLCDKFIKVLNQKKRRIRQLMFVTCVIMHRLEEYERP